MRERVDHMPKPLPLRGYDAKKHSEDTSIHTGSDSRVQQQYANEVDVNTIMKRYGITATAPLGPATGVYGDFTDIEDYESAVERIRGAEARFMALPAAVRERFGNNPGELIRRAYAMPPEEFTKLFAGDVVVDKPAEPV